MVNVNYKLDAVILKSKEIKEVDRIYTIFSREKGKQSILGKGVRKATAKLASGVEPITHSEIFLVSGKWLDRLIGVIIHNQYQNVRQDWNKLKNIKVTFDLLDQLVPEKEAEPQLYEDLLFYLEHLNSISSVETPIAGLSMHLVQLSLIWKMIKVAGVQPGAYFCQACNRKLVEKSGYWFQIPLGIECGNCQTTTHHGKRMKISKDTVKILRVLMEKDIRIAPKLVISLENQKQLMQLTKLMLEETLGKRVSL